MCHRAKKRTSDKKAFGLDISGNVAKERLKLMIDSRKRRLDDDTLSQIRHEIGAVITKYVDIEPENVEIKVILKDYKLHAEA